MRLSIGDGLAAIAAAIAFIGFLYYRFKWKARRLEVVHRERLAAMEKGIPLPEIPFESRAGEDRAANHVGWFVLGLLVIAFGVSAAFLPLMTSGVDVTSVPSTTSGAPITPGRLGAGEIPILLFPLGLIVLGVLLYKLLTRDR